jgi:hypothetical protein
MPGRTEKRGKSPGFTSENKKIEALPKCEANQRVKEIEKLVFLKKSGVSVLALVTIQSKLCQ